MEFATFIIFAMTTLVVVSSPGPAAITIASQGAGNGVWRAQRGIAGVASANAVYFLLSATGVASLIIASNFLFMVIKWIGVGYLTYLGVAAIFSKSGGLSVQARAPESARILFAKGFVVEFANPKALLYFAAILPQFVDVSRPIAPQLAIMGVTTVALDFTIYSAYAMLGAKASRSGMKAWLVKGINRTAGGALLFAAAKMARVSN